MAQEHSEFREVEFRYGFSFPWFMLPDRMQSVIDELEESLRLQDLRDDLFQAELQSLVEVYYQRVGLQIIEELAERYDLAIPQYWY